MKVKSKIYVVGAGGRMGTEICGILQQLAGVEVISKFDFNYINSNSKSERIKQVCIDFSSPKGMRQALNFSLKNKIPFLSGTTGLSKKDFQALKDGSKKIPILWSPNMSVGINLILNIIEKVGKTFSSFDIQVEESHHKFKKDSPSGTAIALQKKIERVIHRKLPEVLSARGGGVVGQHRIMLMGPQEVIQLEHTALNRKVFAQGAVEAALWLQGKKPKLYSMQDFIND